MLRGGTSRGQSRVNRGPSVTGIARSASRVVVMTPRPGRIATVIDVDLPYPRNFETRESPRFFELVTVVREALKEEFLRHE